LETGSRRQFLQPWEVNRYLLAQDAGHEFQLLQVIGSDKQNLPSIRPALPKVLITNDSLMFDQLD